MSEQAGTHSTLVGSVMTAIRQRIAARSLPPGAKLPSIRGFAETMRVSKSTVVEAYDRLVAEGAIQSRRGSGFVVIGHPPPLALADLGPRLERAVDPLWVSRQSLEAGAQVLKPGCGWLPPDWMPETSLRRAIRTLSRAETAGLTDYGSPLGLLPLRQFLTRQMAEHGIEASPAQILLTGSGTEAIDLLCRFLIEPGDTVLVDDPCYFNYLALLRAHRAKIVSVPYTAGGPDIEQFAAVLAQHRPRLYITNSGVHNPTGATLSPVVAHKLLKLAEQAGLVIIEDDIFADLEPEHDSAPRLAAFDGLAQVIHIGSFSKTLSAAIRCGYIAARPDWIEGLIDLRIATTFGSAPMSAAIVLDVLKDGSWRKHISALCQRLARAAGETTARLRNVGILPWIEPRAGMFLWCQLPEGCDAAEIARRALAEDVILAPGNVFSLSQSASRFMRFNVAQSADPRIFAVLEHAMWR